MALNLSKLKLDIFNAFASKISDDLPKKDKVEAERSIQELAASISTAIQDYVKSGDVKTETKGSTSDGILITGTGKGKIS